MQCVCLCDGVVCAHSEIVKFDVSCCFLFVWLVDWQLGVWVGEAVVRKVWKCFFFLFFFCCYLNSIQHPGQVCVAKHVCCRFLPDCVVGSLPHHIRCCDTDLTLLFWPAGRTHGGESFGSVARPAGIPSAWRPPTRFGIRRHTLAVARLKPLLCMLSLSQWLWTSVARKKTFARWLSVGLSLAGKVTVTCDGFVSSRH